ncbi:MAG: exosortase-dependent surface protein XDP2 [Paracoccaceae bacterium]
MRELTTVGATALAGTLLAGTAAATTLLPSAGGVAFSTPAGSTDTTSPFTDDVLLDSLTFTAPGGGEVVYDGTTGSFSVARSFEVTQGRSKFNAEFGDNDTDADGDPAPFTKAGFPGAAQETTDPTIQDAALLNAFNSRSLSEITDGESAGTGQFVVGFENTLTFDDVGGDGLPDIVFFERGGNDEFDVELITGGTLAAPVFSDPLTIDSGDFASAGFSIDTVEIGNSQLLTVAGFDLAAFGLGAGDRAGGFRLTADDGPDLGGFFLATEDPEDFGAPLPDVPLPPAAMLLLGSLGGLVLLRRATA